MLHAWKSDKYFNFFKNKHQEMSSVKIPPRVVYLNPEGNEVICNFVSHSEVDSGTKWDDVEYIGPVTEWVRSIY